MFLYIFLFKSLPQQIPFVIANDPSTHYGLLVPILPGLMAQTQQKMKIEINKSSPAYAASLL
jgi:hypothetical protein